MSKRNNYLSHFLLFASLSVFVLILNYMGFLGFLSHLSTIFSPVRSIQASVASGDQEASLAKVSQDVDLKQMTDEISALKDQFANTYPASHDLIPAKVIGFPTFIPGVTPPEYIVIDKGKKDGIKKGQAVILASNLVGKISDLNDRSSRIILVTDKRVSFTGKLESGGVGVIRGVGEGVEMDNILLTEEVKKDSLIYTKGDQDIDLSGFPPDIVVGRVLNVEKKSTNIFQKVEVSSLIDFTKLTYVFVYKE